MVDIPGDTTTSATIGIGALVEGAIDTVGDHDWFRITLNAGQKITIAVNLLTLEDSYVYVRDANGVVLGENDDGGGGRGSRLVFTAPTSGTYYIDVAAWSPSEPVQNYTGIGTYNLSVTNYVPPPVGTLNEFANQLTHGFFNGASHHFDVTQGGTITVDLTAVTTAGRTVALQALEQWSDIIGINFVEAPGSAQIVFDDLEQGTGAFANAVHANGITTSAIVNVSVPRINLHTYMHEIGHALGLGHTSNSNAGTVAAIYPNDAIWSNDGAAISIMSYFDNAENAFYSSRGFSHLPIRTPQVADMIAIGNLYGLSTTTRTGNTTYGFNNSSGRTAFDAALQPNVAYTIFDSAGIDTLDYSGFASDQRIDLNAEAFSNVGAGVGNVVIARGTAIENAIGGSGHDILTGNPLANMLVGGAGNDVLFGGGGNNILVGGPGADTAEFVSARAVNAIYALGETVAVLDPVARRTDRAEQVELLRFSDGTIDTATLPQFRTLEYIAGYDDLARAFGTDSTAGFLHFAYHGLFEGRIHDGFDGFDYLASHDDLMAALQPNETAAAQHFIAYGLSEGRSRDSFNGLEYLASYDDLILAFGDDESAASQHFVSHGFAEGRLRDAFDALQYLAGYDDLISAFGANAQAASSHFIAHGSSEGRSRDAFDADQYLDNYADLRAAFGDDQHAATLHYVTFGYFEGRTDTLIGF